ncbi:ROK family protein [Facklamia sp. 7083-14-GEN3]|uniref:ROK family protein n=1 Tax=Facklamia sp. 7083-14-GEN3 TaxID=2973478 RepID=UPI00215C5B70|nr:ROK family protein [Facklamia sp. 7083-14-GEN3]MCR8968808.1 ROK family protein [Facklamia sp. 7083-14-GEN3]
MLILAIDIGGTTIKSDVYDEKGHSFDYFIEEKTPIDSINKTNDILDYVLKLVGEIIRNLEKYNKRLEGVAISSAGVIDPDQGKVVYAGYTIPGYMGTDFKQAINQQFDLPCIVLNDVNAAAFAEFSIGDFAPNSSLVCLTIGTGVGGSLIVNGKLYNGEGFSAGEVGYLPVNGKRFQDVASTTAILQYYEHITGKKNTNGKIIFEAYMANQPEAIETIEWFTDNFSEGLLPIIYLINPEYIVLGGGIMHQHKILLPIISDKLTAKIENKIFLPKDILPAKYGNEAGRMGALYYFLKKERFLRR